MTGKPNGDFIIKLRDADSGDPLVGVLASVERGCLYCENHNSYEFGGISDADGIIHIRTDFEGRLGIHTFQNGYLYGRAGCDTRRYAQTVINMKKSTGETPPTLSNLRVDSSTVAPGGTFTLRVDLQATPTSTNSDETLWVEPVEGRSGRIKPDTGDPDNPPNKQFPDGPYSVQIRAPGAPGDYEYFATTTAENCVTGDRLSVRVTVQ